MILNTSVSPLLVIIISTLVLLYEAQSLAGLISYIPTLLTEER